jgi:Kef-type K+ transport system membrane component KefB
MTHAFALAGLWLALAVLATILANHLRVSMALVEICVGIAAGAAAEHFLVHRPIEGVRKKFDGG